MLVKSIPHQKNKGFHALLDKLERQIVFKTRSCGRVRIQPTSPLQSRPTAPASRTPPASHRATAATKAVGSRLHCPYPRQDSAAPVATRPDVSPAGPPRSAKPHAPPTSGPEPRAPPITASHWWCPMMGCHAIAWSSPRATARSERPVKQVPSGARGRAGVMRNRMSSPGSRRARGGERDELPRDPSLRSWYSDTGPPPLFPRIARLRRYPATTPRMG